MQAHKDRISGVSIYSVALEHVDVLRIYEQLQFCLAKFYIVIFALFATFYEIV